MKVFISELDRQNARRIALMNLANFFNIQNWETKSIEVLSKDLENLTSPQAKEMVGLLKEYFKSYDEWFMFYQKIKKREQKENREIELSDNERLELLDLSTKREGSLKTLQERFDELQLDRFNKKVFNKKISGINKKD